MAKSSAAVEPADGSFDDPAFWQNLECLCGVGPLDDFQVHLAQDGAERRLELRSLIAAIGVELEKEGVKTRSACNADLYGVGTATYDFDTAEREAFEDTRKVFLISA